MKTITLTDDQFDTLFEFVDQKVEYIVEKSIDYQDSEILNEWDDLIDVHNLLEDIKDKYEQKLQKHRQSNLTWSGKMMPLVILVLLCFSIQLASDVWR